MGVLNGILLDCFSVFAVSLSVSFEMVKRNFTC